MAMTQESFRPNADELIARNLETAADFANGDLEAAPTRRLAVVACMDSRMEILRILGLGHGEAHVVRNAGGVITDDVIRSLCLSQRYMGTREVLLLHHSDCGLSQVSEDEFNSDIEAEFGVKPTWALEAFDDPFADVRQSLQRLQSTPFLRHKDHLRGFVYDVADGLIHEVT